MKFPAFEPISLVNHEPEQEIIDIPLNHIIPDENQPRKVFSEHSLDELAASIRQHGLIQPIIVRKDGNKYILIAGERRWRAANRAQLKTIPAIVREYSKASRMAITLIENIQRENLNPLEEAQAINDLLTECNMTHTQVAESIGRSRTTVTNFLRLLNLEFAVKQMIMHGQLEMGHARALLGLNGDQQIYAANLIINKKLSVRETEKLVQKQQVPQQKSDSKINLAFDEELDAWMQKLPKSISNKISVQINNDGKGRISIKFNSLKEAEWVMKNIKFQCEEELHSVININE